MNRTAYVKGSYNLNILMDWCECGTLNIHGGWGQPRWEVSSDESHAFFEWRCKACDKYHVRTNEILWREPAPEEKRC